MKQVSLPPGLDVNKLMVPTPPALRDNSTLQDYRNKSVISSWFSSFGDAGGDEFKEYQFSVGGEYVYNDQFSLRAVISTRINLRETVNTLRWVLGLNTMCLV